MAGFDFNSYIKNTAKQLQNIQGSPDIRGYLMQSLNPQSWMDNYGARYASANRPAWMTEKRFGDKYNLYSSLLNPSSTMDDRQLNRLLGMTIPRAMPTALPDKGISGIPHVANQLPSLNFQNMLKNRLGTPGQGVFGTAARTYGGIPGNEWDPVTRTKTPKATNLDIFNNFKGQTPTQNTDWLNKYAKGLTNYNKSIASNGFGGLIGTLMAGGLGLGFGVPGFGSAGLLKR